MPDKKDDRDIFEKVFDETGNLVPATLMVAGGAIGRKYGKRLAKRDYEHLHNIRPGEAIWDKHGRSKIATQKDADELNRLYGREVGRDTLMYTTYGAGAGAAAGMPIMLSGGNRKRRK